MFLEVGGGEEDFGVPVGWIGFICRSVGVVDDMVTFLCTPDGREGVHEFTTLRHSIDTQKTSHLHHCVFRT